MTRNQTFLLLAFVGFFGSLVILLASLAERNFDMAIAVADFAAFIANPFGLAVMIWLFTAGTALVIFVTHEALVRRDYYLFWTILVLLIGGIGTALPFYLYLRGAK